MNVRLSSQIPQRAINKPASSIHPKGEFLGWKDSYSLQKSTSAILKKTYEKMHSYKM